MSAEHILIWGLRRDPPVAAVWDALNQIGCRVTFLDQHAVLDTEAELSVGCEVGGRLRVGCETINLGEVSAVYFRPSDWRDLPVIAAAGRNSDAWWHALNLHDILHAWADLTPALVVNRPAAMTANGSKPYQACWIRSFGFQVPDTLITTDPTCALEFWRQHQKVVYKSLSAIRSIVSRLTEEHMPRLADIAWCPTHFQEYVPGTDYRVHVVGDEVFACKILSEADDYRYAAEPAVMEACDLPCEVAAQSKRLAVSMSLPVSGIDLRCTPQGQWYCFEVNPSPGFTCFQDRTEQPIAEAIARLLASAPARLNARATAGAAEARRRKLLPLP